MNSAPLAGVTVIELSTFVAAPSCTRLLADLGATVIKIEGFSGDPWRKNGLTITRTQADENPIYDVYNIGKQDICINIKEEKGLACLMRLLETADVFITNTRPKSLKKLGLDADSLTARFPRLVYASLNGFGQVGPDADRPGFDSVAFWTRSGFLADMSYAENAYPILGPTGIGDSICGCTLAYGILAALFKRTQTGKGDIVSTSLYGSAIWFMSSMMIGAQKKYNWKFPKQHDEAPPLGSTYQCADGNWLFMLVLDYARQAPKVYEILGIQAEVTKLGPLTYAEMRCNPQLVALIEAAFKKKPVAEWLELLQAADIVADRLNHFRDVPEDEQAWVNHYLESYQFRNGESCALPCPPIQMGSYERATSPCAPRPGEHTDIILRQIGYSEEEIQDLHTSQAVQ